LATNSTGQILYTETIEKGITSLSAFLLLNFKMQIYNRRQRHKFLYTLFSTGTVQTISIISLRRHRTAVYSYYTRLCKRSTFKI